ncbi:MAG: cadherin-like domain-containing protein [Deltaproteobacteria bacterium]|nr:cadherin-like domain-containing protein [Deltaproteobacteria bacterium]
MDVQHAAVLELEAGAYSLGALRLGGGARLEVLGRAIVRVASEVSVGARGSLGPAPGLVLSANDLRIEVAGAQSRAVPIVTFGESSRARALVLAPGGTIRLGQAAVQGALLGGELWLPQDASVTREDGWGSPPVANAGGRYSGTEGSPIELSAAESFDPDGDALDFAWDLDADGAFDEATGEFVTWTFPGDGEYIVGVRVTDSAGESSTATSAVSVQNLAPVVDSMFVTVAEDSGLITIFPLSHALDWDELSIASVTQPASGCVSIVGDALVVELPPDFHGTLTFEVEITDGALSTFAPIQVEVTPTPDAPVALSQEYTVLEDEALFVAAPGVLVGAFDADGDPLCAELLSSSPHASLTELSCDGSLRVVPLPNFEGELTLSFAVSDGQLRDEAGITVHVPGINDGPAFVSAPLTEASVGAAYSYSPVIFDPDLGDLVELSLEVGQVGMTLVSGTLEWVPTSGGDFEVRLRATDRAGATATQEYSIHTVQPNRAPHIDSVAPRSAAVGQLYVYAVSLIARVQERSSELRPDNPQSRVLRARRTR